MIINYLSDEKMDVTTRKRSLTQNKPVTKDDSTQILKIS